ncbi:MAG: OmpA family protein [Gammaproteobacteria bacterium]|nr:OmpA family protein [Gammaproteobacteria bacterium]
MSTLQEIIRRYKSLILIGIVLLIAFGFWINTRIQASKFLTQVQTMVTEAGLSMENIEVRDKQITLSGEIENQAKRAKLLGDLQALPDINTVVDGLTLQRTALPTLSMRGFAGSLTLTGTLPDQESVDHIVGLLDKRFDNIDNQLQVDASTIAPEWLGQFEKLAPELAALEPLTFRIDGNEIHINGIVRDRSKRDLGRLALQTVFGDEYNVNYQVSLPAPTDSARLVYQRDGVNVLLQGVLPNQAMVDQIVAVVKEKLPAAKLQFELSLNSKVSEPGWINQAATMIESLSVADPAGFEINNTLIALSGAVKSERQKSELEMLANNAFSEPVDIDNQLLVVAPVKPAEFVLHVQNGWAILSGIVPDKVIERDLLAASDSVFGPDKVINNLTVAKDVADPEWLQETVDKIYSLKNVKNMRLSANQEGLNLSEVTAFSAEELAAMQPAATGNVRIVEATGLEGSNKAPGANADKEQLEASESEVGTAIIATTNTGDSSALTPKLEQLRDSLADIAVSQIQFAPNSTELTAESKTILDPVSGLLGKYNSAVVEVGGHTDSQGSENYNQKLSQQRADSVVRYLVDKGTREKQLKAKGYGESKPVADNATESGRATNRRIEFTVLNQS